MQWLAKMNLGHLTNQKIEAMSDASPTPSSDSENERNNLLIENNFNKLLKLNLVNPDDGSPNLPFPFPLITDDFIELFAYFKQARVGNLSTSGVSKPYWFQLMERSKWEAWKELEGVRPLQAKKEYLIKLLGCIEDEESEVLSEEWKIWLSEVNNLDDSDESDGKQSESDHVLTDNDVISFSMVNHLAPNSENPPGEVEVIKIGDLRLKCAELEKYLLTEAQAMQKTIESNEKKLQLMEDQCAFVNDPSKSVEEVQGNIMKFAIADDSSRKLVNNVHQSYLILEKSIARTNVGYPNC